MNRSSPRILVTVAVPSAQADADIAERKNRLYADAIERHGGQPIVVDATSPDDDRRRAFESMTGLLLSGGADIDPARYENPNRGSVMCSSMTKK